jgi:hypothetical protein
LQIAIVEHNKGILTEYKYVFMILLCGANSEKIQLHFQNINDKAILKWSKVQNALNIFLKKVSLQYILDQFLEKLQYFWPQIKICLMYGKFDTFLELIEAANNCSSINALPLRVTPSEWTFMFPKPFLLKIWIISFDSIME